MVAERDNDGSLQPRQLAELMCGHALEQPTKPLVYVGRVLLQLSNISLGGERGLPAALAGVSLTVHGGEIVGVAGVSGNGQRELAEVIAGLRVPSGGHMAVDGVAADRATPRSMQKLGVSSVPEDRIGAGLLSAAPLAESMLLTRMGEAPFSRYGWLNFGAIRRWVLDQMQRFDIRAPGPDIRTGTLSGGNLQKALLARALAFDPLVLVAAQPTRGLDMAARDFVHGQFLGLRGAGRAVLVISEDLEELFALSDRIVVMYEGQLVGDVATGQTSISEIGLLMTGGRQAA
jgi:simple sugar transport system ATP-binding protein